MTGNLDRGEAEVLVLAGELEADLILLDEGKARKTAIIAGFHVMGLLGLFILAKNIGLIHEVRPLINELMAKNFRLSNRVIEPKIRDWFCIQGFLELILFKKQHIWTAMD